MTIEDGDILRVVAKMAIDEDDVQNVYHLEASVTGAPADATVVDEIADWLDDAYLNLVSSMSTQVDFTTIEVWNITQDDLMGIVTWPTRTVGGNGTDQMPPQCAALVLFNTSVNRSQGRKFLPPFGVSSQDPNGSIIAASLANVLLYANKLLVQITGTGWVGVAGNWNPVLVRFAAWTSNQVRDLFATQRRRYLGSGS